MPDMFATALAHHRAGQLDSAATLYRAILEQNPHHADCLNLLGTLLHQKGDSAQAVKLIQRAIQIKPDWPAYYVNLATALRGRARHEEAIQHCRTALKLQPDLAEAHLALGLSLTALKQWAEAETELRWMRDQRPADSRGPQALGNCLREQGRTDEAIASYREALARNPNDGAAHLGLGTELLIAEQNAGAAEPHLQRATELLPAQVIAWTNLGSCLVMLGKEREALAVLEKAQQLAPNDPGVGVNVGQAWLGCGESHKAENCFQAVLRFHPEYPDGLIGLGDVQRLADRADEAIPYYERALRIDPGGTAYKGLAEALWDTGDVDRAVALLRGGIARHPRDVENHVRLGMILSSGGDLKGAAESCRAALKIRPGHTSALVELALNLRAKLPEEERQALEQSLQRPGAASAHAAVHFGLAHVADAREDFAAAAEHLRLGNALMKSDDEARHEAYDPVKTERFIDRLIEVFDAAFFAKTNGWGSNDERPVFVVGMPRSGTTLIEQILASHPQVFGAGERRFAFQSLARLAIEQQRPEPLDVLANLTRAQVQSSAGWHLEQLKRLDGGKSKRIVDKMPDNYSQLGWLAVLFPQARFIHSRRDVRDVALSCWMTNFSSIHWANDLEQIAGRIRGYQRLMEHWRKVLPVPLLEVDYEELVENQEAMSRKIVAWLGLEWDPACLAFHKTERLVKTASVTQVRQPMYSRSVGRWRNYKQDMTVFLNATGRS